MAIRTRLLERELSGGKFGLRQTRRFFLQGQQLAHQSSKGSEPVVHSLPGNSVVTWVGRPSTRNENGRKYKTRVTDCKHFLRGSATRVHRHASPTNRAALTLNRGAQRRIPRRVGGPMTKNATLTYENKTIELP